MKILGQCKACWSTAPASLPISNELRLSCQYKTEDFNQNSISWCSVSLLMFLTFEIINHSHFLPIVFIETALLLTVKIFCH